MTEDFHASESASGFATVEEIFLVAKELPDDERGDYLAEACQSDEQRQRVADMLRDAERAEQLLESVVREPSLGAPSAPVYTGPGMTIDRYKILQRLGEGGFGTVFMAEQTAPISRRVALKIIKAGMDTRQVIARFEAERQALAMMDHPNIARVLDAGSTVTGRPYFVMELVKGVPLISFCNQQKLDTRQRLEVFLNICSAVNHAHQKGVIHRDLKPSNILVALEGDAAVPKIIDFGIAKATQQKLTDKTLFTRCDQFVGTPLYISPEQAFQGALDVDTRADIYSLGVILYELLAGKPPFEPSTLMSGGFDEMRKMICEKDPPLPSIRVAALDEDDRTVIGTRHRIEPAKLCCQLRGDLDWIIMKAIEKNRTLRYETANAFANDVRHYLNHEPVSAAAPSAAYKFRKFARRNKGRLTAAVAIALSLVAGTIASTWQASVARTARDDEAVQRQLAETKVGETAKALTQREEALFESLINQVHSIRLAKQPGWRRSAFAKISQARDLRSDPISAAALRSEVIGCLEGLDVEMLSEFQDAGEIWSLDFSPDGRLLAAASADHHPTDPPHPVALRIWDLDRGVVITDLRGDDLGKPANLSPHRRHHGRALCRFSPDGSYLIFGFPRRQLSLLPIKPAAALPQLPTRDSEAQFVDFDDSGKLIAISWMDGVIGAYELSTGLPVSEEIDTGVRPSHWESPTAVALSGDGKWMAAAGDGGRSVKLYPTRDSRPITLGIVPSAMQYLSFSADNRYLAASLYDGHTYGWDLSTGAMTYCLSSHTAKVHQNAFTADGSILATCGDDGRLQLWNAMTGSPVMQLDQPYNVILSAAASPRGDYIAAARRHPRLYRLDKEKAMQALHGHGYDIAALDFDSTGELMASGSWDGTFRIWQSKGDGFAPLSSIRHPSGKKTDVLTFIGNKKLLAISGSKYANISNADFGIYVYRPGEAKPIARFDPHTTDVTAMATDREGSLMVSGDEIGSVWLVTFTSEGEGNLGFIPRFHWMVPGQVIDIQLFDEDRKVWIASSDSGKGEVSVFDLVTHRTLQTIHLPPLSSAVSSDGCGRLVVGMDDGRLRAFNLADLSPLGESRANHGAAVLALSISPDNRFIASGGADNRAIVWNLKTLSQEFTLPPRAGRVMSLQFSPDQRWLTLSGGDHQIEVWNLPELATRFEDCHLGLPLVPKSLSNPLSLAGGSIIIPPSARDWSLELELREQLESANLRFRLGRDDNGMLSLMIDSPSFHDLGLLAGAPIASLTLESTAVTDLGPLRGMPLGFLNINHTKVGNLEPLRGMMSLDTLFANDTPIDDLGPLEGMKLRHLEMWESRISNLTPLAGMPLRFLHLARTRVADLGPLKGLPLEVLTFDRTGVTDVSPLTDIPRSAGSSFPLRSTPGLSSPFPIWSAFPTGGTTRSMARAWVPRNSGFSSNAPRA